MPLPKVTVDSASISQVVTSAVADGETARPKYAAVRAG
jgi:hypothetical protein